MSLKESPNKTFKKLLNLVFYDRNIWRYDQIHRTQRHALIFAQRFALKNTIQIDSNIF